MQDAGGIDDQVERPLLCQHLGRGRDALLVGKVDGRLRMPRQAERQGATRIALQRREQRAADGAGGTDHQGAIAVREGGHQGAALRKNSVTWPSSKPNLVMNERLAMVRSSSRYIQSSKST
ncbi:hypothetical protein D3C78_1654360 [compost metagenome]